MNKISSLARMGIAHRAFGNPIPPAAYYLIEATENCVADFNPPILISLPEGQKWESPDAKRAQHCYRKEVAAYLRSLGLEVTE